MPTGIARPTTTTTTACWQLFEGAEEVKAPAGSLLQTSRPTLRRRRRILTVSEIKLQGLQVKASAVGDQPTQTNIISKLGRLSSWADEVDVVCA